MSSTLELKIPGFPSDIPDGSFGILASRPGGGKTAFSAWVALTKALNGEKVALLSFELADSDIYDRLVWFADFHKADVKEIMENLFFKSVTALSVDALKALVYKTIEDEKPSLMIVDDSFQVFKGQLEIDTLFKIAALKTETAILLTTQLARNTEIPVILGSSERLANADFVFTLEDITADDSEERRSLVRILKNRYGTTGETELAVDYKASTFYEAA